MNKHNKGFTLVELSLAMVFIAMLLLAIMMTVIQAGRTYNKGLVLQAVNQAGANITAVVRRDFLQAHAHYLSSRGSDAVILLRDIHGVERSGRVCLGGYSYLWNAPEVVSDHLAVLDPQGIVTFAMPGDADAKRINAVRVIDEGAALCEPDARGDYPTHLAITTDITHLLAPKDDDGTKVTLALHSMTVQTAARQGDSSDALYQVRFTIGTSETAEIDTVSQSCRPPNEAAANDEFCAINQFEMIVRTNG